MSWIKGVLIAIDQLGNGVAGGNPDATMSARTGYFAREEKSALWFYWKTMELIINYAFYPIDGPDHCYQAYLEDKDESNTAGSDFMRAVLGIMIIVFCIPLSVVTRVYVLFSPEARFDSA